MRRLLVFLEGRLFAVDGSVCINKYMALPHLFDLCVFILLEHPLAL